MLTWEDVELCGSLKHSRLPMYDSKIKRWSRYDMYVACEKKGRKKAYKPVETVCTDSADSKAVII